MPVSSDDVVVDYSIVFSAVRVGNRGVIVVYSLTSDGDADVELDSELTQDALHVVVDALS